MLKCRRRRRRPRGAASRSGAPAAAGRHPRPRCRRAHGATRCRRCCRCLAAGRRLQARDTHDRRCSSTAVVHGSLNKGSTATWFAAILHHTHRAASPSRSSGTVHQRLPGGGCAVRSSCWSPAKRPLRCRRAASRCRVSSSAGVRAIQPSSGTDSAALRNECPTDTSSGRTCRFRFWGFGALSARTGLYVLANARGSSPRPSAHGSVRVDRRRFHLEAELTADRWMLRRVVVLGHGILTTGQRSPGRRAAAAASRRCAADSAEVGAAQSACTAAAPPASIPQQCVLILGLVQHSETTLRHSALQKSHTPGKWAAAATAGRRAWCATTRGTCMAGIQE